MNREKEKVPVFSEDDLAYWFVEEHIDDLRYCHATRSWIVLREIDGKKWWRKDESLYVRNLVREFLRGLKREHPSGSQKYLRVGSAALINAVYDLITSDQDIAVTPTEMQGLLDQVFCA